MESENIIHELFQQEFIHVHYATTLAQYLNHKVNIPELKQLLKQDGEIDQTHQSQFLPAPPSVSAHPICSYIYSTQHQIIQAKHHGRMLEMFNHYNVWLWHILLLFSTARPVSEFPGFLKNFDLKNNGFGFQIKKFTQERMMDV